MNVKQTIVACVVLAGALVLSACAASTGASSVAAPALPTTQPKPAKPGATLPSQVAASQPAQSAAAPEDLTRTDSNGPVTFEVKPLDLGSGKPTLDFEIAMNTHSVELSSFDLKQLAVLKTDTGAEIAPSAYQGGGGHHATATLSFPSGKLAGAKTLTLLIKNVAGVPERTFTWKLQ